MAIKQGFSLIELTVVIGLMSLLSLAIASIMLTSIASSNRLRTATRTKQAGSYALDQMQSLLRSAKSVVSCSSDDSSIQVIGIDGGATTLSTLSDGENTRIASNSGYLTPEDSDVLQFQLTCDPSDDAPTLVNISFDLEDTRGAGTTQSPALHFETSINLRNQN